MDLRIGAATDVGRRRSNNEDAVAVHDHVVAVADGLGGHPAGEVASSIAVSTAVSYVAGHLDGPVPAVADRLAEAMRRANRAVHDDARSQPERQGMGTTLTLAAFHDDHLVVAHVGDSRAYLLRDGVLRVVTTDHATGPYTLTRVIGPSPEVEVDVYEPLPLRTGDRVLLCSDGLTAVIPDTELPELLRGEPEVVVQELVDLTLQRGAPDNVTVAVVEVAGGRGSGRGRGLRPTT